MMYRLIYSKAGFIKFISHLDLVRLWQRAFRRAGVKVVHTRGYSPHPRMSFGPPLPVGIEGLREICDVDLLPGQDVTSLIERLGAALPEGVRVLDANCVDEGGEPPDVFFDFATYEVELENRYGDEVRSKVAQVISSDELEVRERTEKGERVRDVRPLIREIEVEHGGGKGLILRFTIAVGAKGNLNPREFLRAVLGLQADAARTLPIKRTALLSSGIFQGESRGRP